MPRRSRVDPLESKYNWPAAICPFRRFPFMKLMRLAHILAAKRGALALVLTTVLVASCNSGSFFGTLPARFRVFNALIDGGPVNLTVFTEAIVTGLPFEGITTYQNVDAGNREVKVCLAGGTPTIYDQTQLILDDASYTYVVSGTSAAPRSNQSRTAGSSRSRFPANACRPIWRADGR